MKKYSGWIWFWISIAFLVFVHVIFTIHAPREWLEAEWGAGDFITFAGTITLGFVAWKQSEMANETSRRLINLEAAEHLPILTIKSFVGITKLKMSLFVENAVSTIVLTEMRKDDNKVVLGNSLTLIDDGFAKSEEIYTRLYEIHFKYRGKSVVSNINLMSLTYRGEEYEKKFELHKSLDRSLCDNEEFVFFYFLISNHDFINESSKSYSYITASKVELKILITMIDGRNYIENLVVNKYLVKEPEEKLNIPNVEMLVSSAYHVDELVEDD